MASSKVGQRLKALREELNLSQDDVAKMLGIESRQSISQVEAGERRLSADELVKAVESFDVPFDYFTNPFLISGEARFSWRRANVPPAELNAFEIKAGEWIGAFRELKTQQGEELSILLPRLGLTVDSSFEEAAESGEKFAKEFELGDVPYQRLVEVMESKLATLVLNVDASDGISGAACLIRDLSAVLINRNEPEGRRSFDLAHELFHILTWDAMPPERVDGSGQSRVQKRTEQLADNFASALLMPSAVLQRYEVPGEGLVDWLNHTANELRVSAVALKWRLKQTQLLDEKRAAAIDDQCLRNNGQPAGVTRSKPLKFGKRFIQVIATAIAKGDLSVRRSAKLLDISIDELGELFRAYGVDVPFDL